MNIISQNCVEFMAYEYEKVARAITPEEFVEAMKRFLEAGLANLDERSFLINFLRVAKSVCNAKNKLTL